MDQGERRARGQGDRALAGAWVDPINYTPIFQRPSDALVQVRRTLSPYFTIVKSCLRVTNPWPTSLSCFPHGGDACASVLHFRNQARGGGIIPT